VVQERKSLHYEIEVSAIIASMTLRLGSVALSLLLASSAYAQTSLVGGTLEGTISDSAGGRIPDASVVAREVTTGQTHEVSSNAEGVFRIPELRPGTYELSISQAGFAPYRHAGAILPVGSTVRLNIVLQPETLSTQVTVT